ncbi:hypothetical protein DSO57_1004682 [Entomophthora muscae]|uniref:Uncharacterized protein n=1 Tax=Entomophthora muscae TaxID=34485 RepID=A0ACC2U6M8_9FUNG|nr:hypothetical protein DSO57_1004682 [Entomophthora muscae]
MPLAAATFPGRVAVTCCWDVCGSLYCCPLCPGCLYTSWQLPMQGIPALLAMSITVGVLNPIIPTGLFMVSIADQALLKLSVELVP